MGGHDGVGEGAQSLKGFSVLSLFSDYRLLIPGIRPEAYNPNTGLNGWALDYDPKKGVPEEGLFAYKTTGTAENNTSKYAIIRTEGRFYLLSGGLRRPTMERVGKADKLTRMLFYYEPVYFEGSVISRKVVSVTETASAWNHYRVVMPTGTTVAWSELLSRSDMAAAGNGWGAIYYGEVYEGETDEESYSRIEYTTDGKSYVVQDKRVQGKARDARILYNGNNQLLVFLTSTGVKFYPFTGGVYSSGASYVTFDNFIGGQGSSALDSGAFTLVGSKELLVSSMTDGIFYYNTGTGMSFALRDGAYYNTFYTGSNNTYVAVGYQTDEYAYTTMDVARAKVYKISLSGRENELYLNAMESYLEDKIASVKENWYSKDKTDSQVKNETFVKQLFYSDRASAESTLSSFLEGLKLTSIKNELLSYVLKRREELLDQQKGLQLFYNLADVLRVSGSSDEELFQAMEETLMNAYYTSNIEMCLVEVKLFNTVVDQIGDEEEKERYQQYQLDYVNYQQSQDSSNENIASKSITSKNVQKLSDDDLKKLMMSDFESAGSSKTEGVRENLEKMSFYREILADLKERYESTESYASGIDWDTYLKTLLSMLTEGTRTGEETADVGLSVQTEEAGEAAGQ